MEGTSRKRPFPEDEDSNKPPTQKRVRFPKGKKVKFAGDEILPCVIGAAQAPAPPLDLSDPRVAAEERAKQRRIQMEMEAAAKERDRLHSQMTNEDESPWMTMDITKAEVHYEGNSDFVADGIQIEPFNLDQEREEGYFDADGNYVEYAIENQIKDAWLDSVDVDSRYTGKDSDIAKPEEDSPDLSSDDIGKMKRRIADLLEPEETVLQALRRLKGTSTDRKEKMPEEIKLMFDQLTEDSMKLMENGDYNVYHDKREVFEREAEGYERIARAKEGTSVSAENGYSDHNARKDLFSNGTDHKEAPAQLSGSGLGFLTPNVSTAENASGIAADDFDMFAEDDENPNLNSSTNEDALSSGSTLESQFQPSSEGLHTGLESGDSENDYVYDESSGYYYNSTLGYYYDPATGLYCSANSGIWYSYNEQMGTYEEVQGNTEYPVT